MDNKQLRQDFGNWSLTNGLFIGLCDCITEPEGPLRNRPNAKANITIIYNTLIDAYVHLNVDTAFGKTVDFVYPDDAPWLRHTGKPTDYAHDMAMLVLFRAMKSMPNGIQLDWLFDTLKEAAGDAITSTLILIKGALNADNQELIGMLLGDGGYLEKLMYSEQLSSFNITSMRNNKSMVFLPDENTEESAWANNESFHLNKVQFDKGENCFFPELVYFIFENEDGAMTAGEAEVMFKKGRVVSIIDDFNLIMNHAHNQIRNIVKKIQL